MTMTKQFKVLWIEDDAHMDLGGLATPVHIALKYKLVTVLQVSEGVDQLLKSEYDVVITDVRFKADKDPAWWGLTSNRANGSSKLPNLGDRLGLQLLYSLLGKEEERSVKITVPPWITPDRFAVFTVEERSTIEEHLARLGVRHYERKQPGLPKRTLRTLIETVLRERGIEP